MNSDTDLVCSSCSLLLRAEAGAARARALAEARAAVEQERRSTYTGFYESGRQDAIAAVLAALDRLAETAP